MGRTLYAATVAIVKRALRGRLTSVTGLEHVPETGPCLLVANHQSAIDHFVLAYVVRCLRQARLFGPTASARFRGPVARAWLDATGAIPVDHSNAGATYARIELLLADERFVVMYPEDKRGQGPGVMPFKLGAFNIAKRMGLPIHPVALIGTAELLPRGHWYPRKTGSAAVVFAPPIPASAIAAAGALAAAAQCRVHLESLLNQTDQGRRGDAAYAMTASLVSRAEQMLTELKPDPNSIRAVQDLLQLALINDPENVAAIALLQRTRRATGAIGR